jgi:plastocyanin
MLSACDPHPAPVREVVVVARGMSFVLAERADVPNPVIAFRGGERVRLVLKNEAPGILHDLVIPEWDVEIEQTRAGESRDVAFTVPDTPGRFEYRCRPHSALMSGYVEVTR